MGSKGKAQRLAVGIIGVGGMGAGHCRNIKKVKEMRLAAVVDLNPKVAEETGKKYRVPWFTSHTDMIKSGVCEAAMVVTPHPHHAAPAIDCMKAGLHVICEKPLAEKVSAADAMLREAKKRKVVFAAMFQRRFEPQIAKAIELVKAGRLGEIRRTLIICPMFRTQMYYDSGKWRATWKGEGGGVLVNQSPHDLDIFVQLGGMPVSLSGITGNHLHNIEVEDTGSALLKYANGATGYVHCTTAEGEVLRRLEICGDKGIIVICGDEMSFYEYEQPLSKFIKKAPGVWDRLQAKLVKLPIRKRVTGHADVMRNFARHILFKEKLLCSAESALGSLEIANAITLSAHTGKEVKLPISRKAYDAELEHLRAASTFQKKRMPEIRQTDPHMSK